MADDLAVGRKTEVEYLNGELVRLAERLQRDAPVNRAIVELVHKAEAGAPPLAPRAPGLEIRRTDLAPNLAQRVLVVLLDNDRKMLDRLLQLAVAPRDLAEFVVGVDLVWVDLECFIQVFERSRFLTAFKIDETKLYMSICVARIDGCVV